MVSINGSGDGHDLTPAKESKGWTLWRRKARVARKNEPEEQVEFEEQVLDALEKLSKTCEDVIKRVGKLELKVAEFDRIVKEFRVEEIDDLRKETQRRTLYMEGVFEEMLSNNWTKAGKGNGARNTSMYDKNGKIATPVGKLP